MKNVEVKERKKSRAVYMHREREKEKVIDRQIIERGSKKERKITE